MVHLRECFVQSIDIASPTTVTARGALNGDPLEMRAILRGPLSCALCRPQLYHVTVYNFCGVSVLQDMFPL